MNEALKKRPKYQKRYMQKHKMLCVLLDKEKDAEIIDFLDQQPSKSSYVRNLLNDHVTAIKGGE